MAKRRRIPAALHAELTEYSSLLRALRTSDTLDLASHLIQPPPSFISQASLAGDVSSTEDDDDDDGFVGDDGGENDVDGGGDDRQGGGDPDGGGDDDDDGENDEEALDESPTDSLSQDPFSGVASPSDSLGDDTNLEQPVNKRKAKQRDTWTRWPLLAGDVHIPEWGLSDEVNNIAERVLALSPPDQNLIPLEPNVEDAAKTSDPLNPITEQDDRVPDVALYTLTADSATFLARILALATAHVPAAEKSMQNRITPINWETVVNVACAHGVVSPRIAEIVRARMSLLFPPARPDTTHRSHHLLAMRQRTSQILSRHEQSILDVPNSISDAHKKPVTRKRGPSKKKRALAEPETDLRIPETKRQRLEDG